MTGGQLVDTGLQLLSEKKIWYDEKNKKEKGSANDLVADCQAFMELICKRAGAPMNYKGSNDMFRHACSWTGTLAEAKAQGKLVPGCALFIHKNDGKEPESYRKDGLGNFSHVGLYLGGSYYYDKEQNKQCNVIHSSASRGKACGSTLKNGWTHVGLWKQISYGNEKGGEKMQTMYITSENGKNVNIRSGPSRSYMAISQLAVGTEVQADMNAIENGFVPITWENHEGYVMKEFLTDKGTTLNENSVMKVRTLLTEAMKILESM